MQDPSRIKPGFVWSAIESIGVQAIGMLLSILWVFVVAHTMDQDSVGKLFIAMAVANSVIAVFSFGLPHAFAVKGASVETEILVSTAICATLAVGVAASVAAFIVQTLAPGLSDLWFYNLPLLPMIVFVYAVQILSTTLLRSLTSFRAANVCHLSVFVTFNVALILLFQFHPLRASVGMVMFLFFLSATFGAVLASFLICLLARPSVEDISSEVLRSLFAFGGLAHIGNVAKEIMYRADLFLVGYLLGPAAAALYGVVLRLVEALARFVDALGVVLVPMIARGSEGERRRMSYLSAGALLPVMLVFAVAIGAAAPLLLAQMFGESYIEATTLLRASLVALIPLTIWKILANDLIGRGDARSYIISSIVGALSIVTLSLIMLPQFGVNSAAFTLGVSYALPAGVVLIIASRKYGYSLHEFSRVMIATARRE